VSLRCCQIYLCIDLHLLCRPLELIWQSQLVQNVLSEKQRFGKITLSMQIYRFKKLLLIIKCKSYATHVSKTAFPVLFCTQRRSRHSRPPVSAPHCDRCASCIVAYYPTSLLKQCSHVLLPIITNIIKLSLSTSIFPAKSKNCSVHPHLTKFNLYEDDLGNYRPISHLSFLFKRTERVVKLRLADCISTNNLLNSFKSA